MSENTNSKTKILLTPDPSPDDDIYIDCKPVDTNEVDTNEVDSIDNEASYRDDNEEMLKDLTSTEFNIFQNLGFQTLLAVGIFAVILFSGNYVFNKLPNSRLQKAINKDRFS